MAPQTESEESQLSSFPGIWKFPTDRGTPLRSAVNWMAAKRKDDDIGNFWRVYDKLYDLELFVQDHPGGSDWIDMTRGTDITEAFETSHVVNVKLVENTLAQFYVETTKVPRVSPYMFEEDGFYKTLKRNIGPILKDKGTGPEWTILFLEDTMMALVIILAVVGTVMDLVVLKILAGAVLAIGTIGAHNFFHLRQNWRTYYYDISLQSSYEWRITHALSHHLYPNTLMDIEMEMFPTFDFLPNHKSWIQRFAPIVTSHLVFVSGFWINLFIRIRCLLDGSQKLRPENVIILAELIGLMALAPTTINGVYSWILIHTVSSYVFLTIGAYSSHHHPDIFHDGDEARPNPDFGLCQLDATRNRTDSLHELLLIQMVTFGNHCLHHLFPTVCHSKLKYLRPVLEKTLVEFKEDFPTHYQYELFLGCLRQLARVETKNRSYPAKKLV